MYWKKIVLRGGFVGVLGRLVEIGMEWVLMIRNLDHNLGCIAAYCTCTFPSHSDGRDDGDSSNTMDGTADGTDPSTDHSVRTHTIFVNNAALTSFDRNNNQHSLGTFAVYANYQIAHRDHCSSWQNAVKFNEKGKSCVN